MERLLINNPDYFKPETIESIRKEFKFSQSIHIEMLLWDFEIFAQLTAIHKDFVLKGGAATQIYLPVEKQRASRDIDLATTLTEKEVETELNAVKKRFEERVSNNEHFTWSSAKPPREPKKKIEELHCYELIIPTKIGSSFGKQNASILKIDAICYDKLPFKVINLEAPTLFNLNLKPFPIISKGSLIGDKLLTLADSTVGILAKNEDDYESYFKQIYDLTYLIDFFIANEEVLNDIFFTIEHLTPIELKYRKMDKSIKEVLIDIIESLEKKKYFDCGSSELSQNLRDSITNFRANYLNKEEWLIPDYWAARISKIQFFTKLLLNLIENQIKADDIISIFEKLKKIEIQLADLSGDDIKKMQQALMSYYKGDAKIGKPLKNKPVKTVFYRVLDAKNWIDLSKLFWDEI
ncbi:nucleotidyl transferase AbiEii/AbiGii toxin family protein [Candidatus Woesearchaeota archaeon]|nr:nucleotidyl transferase AbiEii/AbiGii toxin family protein [Candidatus Woesearchaeota archaeon]